MSEHDRAGASDAGEPVAKTKNMTLATPAWRQQRREHVNRLRRSRESSSMADTSLVVVAAQHPLVDGWQPNAEFTKRLVHAKKRSEEIEAEGRRVELLVTGNRHHDSKSGTTDQLALYDAAGIWLVRNAVSPNILRGKDWIQRFRSQGVYSGAAEVQVAAAGFANDGHLRDAEYVCSPGQASRAGSYALAYGLPAEITVPESLSQPDADDEQFHSGLAATLILNGLAMTIDPYGEGVLARMTRDRIPADGQIGSLPSVVGTLQEIDPGAVEALASLPWNQ